ncbi:G2/M phase-specific E3 ubiquitin-protein ligase-like [Siphateles boraxobius]|uniref:G2/M phase-specific E3 ubiquitin-protein ligase-like n=1 Tax=Siphateles boraxobius TaxID=180520 RepID=UPI004063567E
MAPSAAIPQNSQQSSSTTALDETSFSAETTESVNLCEWRAVRSQQDEEYNASLLADIEKDRRRQRMAARVEPLDGEYLKAKYLNGDVNKRKFIMSDPIQVLFDFIGKDEMASEVFRIQEATSSNAIESTSTGSISDHGIKPFCTLYVLWTSPFDNLEKDCDPVNVAQPPVDSPFVQSSVALSPVQSPVALSPVQSPVALSPVQSPVALSPVQSPVALSPVQSLPSVQPSVALFTAQTPFINFNFEDQPKEPIVIDIDEETPLSSPSPQQSDIVDLSLIDQGRSVALDEVDLQTILKKLQSTIDGNICPTANQINVFRKNILQCSLQAVKRRRFNPQAKLDVVFVDAEENGEGAIDEGGPTREYLRLLMRAIHQSNVFQGHEKDRSLALDTQALENRLYASVGKMIAMCVVHGGVGPHFFSERLFQQICGMPTSSASVDEVGDHTLREQLIKIQEATTVQEANCAIAEAANSLSIIGALRYTSHLTERNSLIQSAAEFFVNGRLRAALDQFSEGLQTLGLLEEMQKYPALFYDMFVNEQRPLQAKDLCSLFYVNFSPQGSNRRRAKENQTICYWRDWLIDVEEGETDGVTLEMIMEFVTGASTVPPLGFPHRPEIEFLHQDRKIFPEANTCLIILRLPIHTEYEMFKTYMTEGIMQSPYL